MKRFADLYALLDETTKTSVKVEALRSYFAAAPPADAAWAVYFLIGRKPRQVVAMGRMHDWAAGVETAAPLFGKMFRDGQAVSIALVDGEPP
jgi:DNA ligase 1